MMEKCVALNFAVRLLTTCTYPDQSRHATHYLPQLRESPNFNQYTRQIFYINALSSEFRAFNMLFTCQQHSMNPIAIVNYEFS